MFEQLNTRFARIIKTLRGQGKITDDNIEESIRDIRRALLEADVNFKVAKSFINRVKDKASGEEVFTSVTPGQQFIQILAKEMTSFLGEKNDGLQFHSSGKTVILLVGLQGAGKTTTAAKLAGFLKNRKQKNPYLIAADLQRPAAVKQLQVLGRQVQVPVFTKKSNDVQEVVKTGLAESSSSDVVIIDTAGRLHVDEKLMDELKQIVAIASPHEILYVADGMMGQDAVNSSSAFNNAMELSGIILTKMDGDARGGAALSIREVTGKPIMFIGTGEGITDIDLFHPDRITQRILGMGDVVSLVEKAQDVFDGENTKNLQKKMLSHTFTLADFQEQICKMQKMGSLSDIMGMMPGTGQIGKINLDDRQFKWTDAIIKSMTSEEKNAPEIIDGSRRKRIAKGSGRPVQEVNLLLKQYQQMLVMMKKIGKKGRMQIPFQIK